MISESHHQLSLFFKPLLASLGTDCVWVKSETVTARCTLRLVGCIEEVKVVKFSDFKRSTCLYAKKQLSLYCSNITVYPSNEVVSMLRDKVETFLPIRIDPF